jgi:LmbE family N-acetylglucosaminyl deacetylase
MGEPPSPEKLAKCRRNRKRRIVAYGSIVALLVGFYYYQPNRIDFIPRHLPTPNPRVDPDSATLFRKGTRVAIVTAHPDDAEFFLGGTLTRLGAAGADVTLIVCTNGDKSFYPWEDGEKLGRVRQGEQREAFERWHGARLVFLGYPDGRLHPNDDVKARILTELEFAKPDYILAFDPDFPPRISHGDHRSAGAAVETVAGQTSAKWLLMFQTIAENYTVDISDQWEEKKRLLALHRSQFSGEKLDRVTGFVEDMAISYGEKINVTYGEGFRCRKLG